MESEHIRRLAHALTRAVEAHGAGPAQSNGFALGELHREYGGPSPLVAWQIGMRNMEELRAALPGKETT